MWGGCWHGIRKICEACREPGTADPEYMVQCEALPDFLGFNTVDERISCRNMLFQELAEADEYDGIWVCLSVEEQWTTSDAWSGRGEEKWLNLILRKQAIH